MIDFSSQLGVISIKDIHLAMSIGVTEIERDTKQDLYLDISYKVPLSKFDSIESTVCYDTIITTLIDYCSKMQFQLIETVVKEVYLFLKESYPDNLFEITLKKKPKIKSFSGYVLFCLSDF